MNKPKFLQRISVQNNKRKRDRREKKYEKFLKSDKGRIFELEKKVRNQNNVIYENSKFIDDLKCQIRKKEKELYDLEKERTDPFKADKWKVVYDTKGKVSTVYFNDQELFGVHRFDIDFDPEVDGHTPRFTLEGFGSIEVITESE